MPKKKVLVIDDDPSVSAALLMLLKDEFDTHTAGTVRDGVDLFGSLRPDVVVLDLHLPDSHGLEALRSIRAMSRSAPVVILTGYATLEAVEESMRLGAADCLRKPFNAQSLRLRLRELSQYEREETEVAEAASGYGASDSQAVELASSSFLHDVSNPLTSLLALSAMLRENVEDPAKRRRLADMIDENVGYLAALVDQWRAFVEPDKVDEQGGSIEEIVAQAVSLVRLRAEAKNVEIAVEAGGAQAQPRLNRHAVVRVLVNLLQNAIEAVDRRTGSVEFRAQPKGGLIEFSVRDNGPGIDPAAVRRIFQPRYTTKKKGTGLGLFIARRIVESANGSISLCSRPGRGATFTVQLPAR